MASYSSQNQNPHTRSCRIMFVVSLVFAPPPPPHSSSSSDRLPPRRMPPLLIRLVTAFRAVVGAAPHRSFGVSSAAAPRRRGSPLPRLPTAEAAAADSRQQQRRASAAPLRPLLLPCPPPPPPLVEHPSFKIVRTPHNSQKLIYKIYIFAQFSKLELVQLICSVKRFISYFYSIKLILLRYI